MIQAPGIHQSLRLSKMADSLGVEITEWEQKVSVLEGRIERMKRHLPTQERAIRESLGYASFDEWVFEISSQTTQNR